MTICTLTLVSICYEQSLTTFKSNGQNFKTAYLIAELDKSINKRLFRCCASILLNKESLRFKYLHNTRFLSSNYVCLSILANSNSIFASSSYKFYAVPKLTYSILKLFYVLNVPFLDYTNYISIHKDIRCSI